jgi:predicted RNase H-like HicB family nuclease
VLYYIAILSQSIVGEWHVQFPDVPWCEAYGFTVCDATFAASTALAKCAEENGDELPPPRDLAAIERDDSWRSRHDIDLSNAVVTLIPLRVDNGENVHQFSGPNTEGVSVERARSASE